MLILRNPANYHLFQCCVQRQELHSFFDIPSFNMLFKCLKDCLTVKQAILGLLAEEKTNK